MFLQKQPKKRTKHPKDGMDLSFAVAQGFAGGAGTDCPYCGFVQ